MIPVSVSLKGFGSFKELQRFDFPRGPGLHFMSGLNLVEPRLGTNGAGKTTLWNAIRWAIFDKAANGLRAGDVANWDAPKGAWVAFTFEHEGEAFEVYRKHAPNEWVMHCLDTGEPVELVNDETNPVLAMLRLQASTWDQCVLMAQGEDMFLDLKPEPKAELFSGVMGLDKWLRASDRASKRAADVLDEVRGLDRRIGEVSGTLDGIGTLEDLQRQHDDWEDAADRRIAEWNREVRELGVTADKAKTALTQWKENTDEAEAAVREFIKVRNTVYENNELAYKALSGARERRAVAEAECERLERLINSLYDNRTCPTCGAPDAHKGPAAKQANQDLNAADLAADECTAHVARREAEYDDAKAALAEHDRVADRKQRFMEDARGTERKCRNDLELCAKRIEDLLDRIDENIDLENPHKRQLDEARARMHTLKEELAALQQRVRGATEKHALLGFWVRGFKDLRLRQIDSALGELEAETAACLSDLGLEGWELQFDVDRESKSGAVRPGFSVHVRSPRNDKPVPWASWSGGEKQRLRVAAQMGLANLIRSGTGAAIDLEVWDEPTQGMNARGIADLLGALKERAALEKRQIWVVDHHTLGYSDFDSVVTVVKDEKGSRFEYGQE